MPEAAVGRIGDQSPKPRIVQYRNRRYSIRLEPVFWRALERLAERNQMRLGRFVADLAERHRGGNFSSHLRVICMLEAERTLAGVQLRAGEASLVDMVSASFNPGLVLSRYRTIVAHNDAFAEWLGADHPALLGADLTSIVQVRTKTPLNEIWLDMIAGNVDSAEARVLYVEPGRVLAAPARLLAIQPRPGEDFYALMWVSSGPKSPAPARAPGTVGTKPI